MIDGDSLCQRLCHSKRVRISAHNFHAKHSHILHLYTADPTFPSRWLEGHVLAAAAIGKPLILSEIGTIAGPINILTVRNPLFRCWLFLGGAHLD